MIVKTDVGTEIQALKITPPSGKSATILVLPVESLARLKEREIVFTPTIDLVDDDSTRKGPNAQERRRGYQRPPEAPRVRKISAYYQNDDILGFTTPIVAAVRKKLSSKELVERITEGLDGKETWNGQLERSIAIIDGQHRMDGVLAAYENDPDQNQQVVIVCVHDLSYQDETEVFNVINTTPKRLPKALTEWNKFGITESGSTDPAQEIRQLVVDLATDKDSVWEGKINFTGTGRDPKKPVTLEGIRRSTENMFRAGSLKLLKPTRKKELAKHFWKAVTEVFPEAWSEEQKMIQLDDGQLVETGTQAVVDGKTRKVKRVEYRLKDLVGVASLSKLGGEIISEAQGSDSPEIYITNEVNKISEVNWVKDDPTNMWTSGQAGFAGQKGLFDSLAYLRAYGVAPWADKEE
jgi:DGQHR domain-containing protein